MAQKSNVIRMDRRAARRRMMRNSPDKRLRLVYRLRRIFGIMTMVAVILFCAANASLFTKVSLQRLGGYITAGLAAKTSGDRIEFETGNTASLVTFGDGIAIADNDTLTLQTAGGIQLSQPLGYSSPALCTTDRYVLAYDRQGYGATLASGIAVASTQTTKSQILSGCLGASGDYALITDEAGYKSAVTVYSSGGKQRFKWATPDEYFQAAALSPDGRCLAVASFKQAETTLEGTLYFRNLDSKKITKQVSLGSTLPFAVGYLDDSTVAVIGDYSTVIIDRKGNVRKTIAYSADDLDAFHFGGNTLALLTRSYSGDARSELIMLDAGGDASEPLSVHEEVQAIDYDGARLALLTTSGLTVYDSNLRALWTNTDAAGAHAIGLTKDGGVWLLYPKQAHYVSSASDTSEDVKKS